MLKVIARAALKHSDVVAGSADPVPNLEPAGSSTVLTSVFGKAAVCEHESTTTGYHPTAIVDDLTTKPDAKTTGRIAAYKPVVKCHSIAVADECAITSRAITSLPSKVYTADDLRHIEKCKLSNPNLKKTDLPSGKRFAHMETVTLVAGQLFYGLKLMLSLDDDEDILQEMKQHLEETGSLAKAEKFIKDRYFINWGEFYKRNRAEIDAATVRQQSKPLPVAEQVVMAHETLVSHLDDNYTDNRRKQDIIYHLAKDCAALLAHPVDLEKKVPPDGKEMHYQRATPNVQRTIVAKPTAAPLAPATAMLFPITPEYTSARNRSVTTTAAPLAPATATLIPFESILKNAENRRYSSMPKTSVTTREPLEQPLPLTEKGNECEGCKKCWKTKFEFCWVHEHLLKTQD